MERTLHSTSPSQLYFAASTFLYPHKQEHKKDGFLRCFSNGFKNEYGTQDDHILTYTWDISGSLSTNIGLFIHNISQVVVMGDLFLIRWLYGSPGMEICAEFSYTDGSYRNCSTGLQTATSSVQNDMLLMPILIHTSSCRRHPLFDRAGDDVNSRYRETWILPLRCTINSILCCNPPSSPDTFVSATGYCIVWK